MCRDIFNTAKRKVKEILYLRKGEKYMAKFICARVMIAYLEDGKEGARIKYNAYFEKKSLQRFKEATDALIREEKDIAFLLTGEPVTVM